MTKPWVSNSDTWRLLFGAKPPRGAVARIARRCNVNLDITMQAHGYESLQEFKKEVRRFYAWYKKGKRSSRRRRGTIRERQHQYVRAAKTIMTGKVRRHFRRLLKPLRLEGLWEWAKVARALHEAGIPVTTGTVRLESFWKLAAVVCM